MKAPTLTGTLCIRADAGPQMGIGHVMRCLALAQAWQDAGGQVLFVTATENPALRARIREEGVHVVPMRHAPASPEDAAQTAALARDSGAAWLVLDGYHFTPAYRSSAATTGLRLLIIDDLADSDLTQAKLILNQNVCANPVQYAQAAPQARFLGGTRYALLRREFLQAARQERAVPAQARRILVMMGGSDPQNTTLDVLRVLTRCTTRNLHITVIVGAANPHLEALRAALPKMQAQHDVELRFDPPDVPGLMQQADAAISAAGSTCWELACMGVPMALLAIADNQRAIFRHLTETGAAAPCDLHDPKRIAAFLSDHVRRADMAQRARALVDGRGAARVVAALIAWPLQLRHATADDARLIWEWANDPITRQASFTTEPIPWETHIAWFQRRLASAEDAFFIALDENSTPVGQVRFQRGSDGSGEISLSLAPGARGRGLGTRLIYNSTFQILDAGFCQEVRGWVKTSNTASLRAFAKAGFTEHQSATLHGCPAVQFRCARAAPGRGAFATR